METRQSFQNNLTALESNIKLNKNIEMFYF